MRLHALFEMPAIGRDIRARGPAAPDTCDHAILQVLHIRIANTRRLPPVRCRPHTQEATMYFVIIARDKPTGGLRAKLRTAHPAFIADMQQLFSLERQSP